MTHVSRSPSVSLPASVNLPLPTPAWHAAFLEMLPKIEEQARYRFRHLKDDHRDEAVQEVTANACQAYERLVQRGKAAKATWSSLARYAIRQVQAGRKVGSSLNLRDVSSCHCQLKTGIRVEPLFRWDEHDQQWREMVVEDRNWSPADVAAFRIDFRGFLKSLSRRNRKLTLHLAKGHSTGVVARAFRISKGRVSQLRRELAQAWREFQGELFADEDSALTPAAAPGTAS